MNVNFISYVGRFKFKSYFAIILYMIFFNRLLKIPTKGVWPEIIMALGHVSTEVQLFQYVILGFNLVHLILFLKLCHPSNFHFCNILIKASNKIVLTFCNISWEFNLTSLRFMVLSASVV